MRATISAFALGAVVIGCDNSQAARHVSPGWERMQTQARGETFGESSVFADDRAMRTPPAGTMPRNSLEAVDSADGGMSVVVDVQMINEGRTSFETYCAACHGMRGDGDSVVASKMQERRPPSLYEPRIVQLSDTQIEAIVRQGYGFMPSYASALGPQERWQVVAYVRALQATEVPAATLPPDAQSQLAQAARVTKGSP